MAYFNINQTTVIRNYIKSLGAVGNVRGGNLEEQINAFWDAMFKSHLLRWNWDFMQIDNEELDVIDGEHLEVERIAVILAARSTSTGGSSIKIDLLGMHISLLKVLRNRAAASSVATKYIIKGGVATGTVRKLFLHPIPASGTKVTITGIADPDNDPALVIKVPISHEAALFKAIDWKLGKGTFEAYREEVAALGGQELRDIWGVQYGVG